MSCPFIWFAPTAYPNGEFGTTLQTRSLPRKHEELHQSSSKVICPKGMTDMLEGINKTLGEMRKCIINVKDLFDELYIPIITPGEKKEMDRQRKRRKKVARGAKKRNLR